MIRTIAGRHNPSLKLARRLQSKKYRAKRGFFMAEGWDLLHAALTAGVWPAELLVRDDIAERLSEEVWSAARTDRLDVAICQAETLAGVSALGGAADVVAVFPERRAGLSEWNLGTTVTLFLHEVGDPGNVGTLIRSASAFGAAGVACSPRTSDPFGVRALRAGMGAHFLLPVATEVSPADLMAHVRARAQRGDAVPALVVADPRGDVGSRDLAGELRRARTVGRPDEAHGVVVALGSERGGLPDLADAPWAAQMRVAVPQVRFDSLNVAMAGTIVLYELQTIGQTEGR